MKEYDEFRFVLEDLKETYGDNPMIRCIDICRAEHTTIKTVKSRYGIPKGARAIDRAVLARRKCQLAHE